MLTKMADICCYGIQYGKLVGINGITV